MRRAISTLVDDVAPRAMRETAQQYVQLQQRRKNKEREKRAGAPRRSDIFHEKLMRLFGQWPPGSSKHAADKIPGGLADAKPDAAFPKDQLRKGRRVELEHTDDPALAKEIAKDHLEEDRRYYDKLERMEKSAFWSGFEKAAAVKRNPHEKHLVRLAAHNETALERRSAHITYHKQATGRVVKRRIDPLRVRGGLVVAYDHKRKAVRSFKLDRIRHLEKLPHAEAARPKP